MFSVATNLCCYETSRTSGYLLTTTAFEFANDILLDDIYL